MKKYDPVDAPLEWIKLQELFSIYERMGVLYKEGVLDIEMMYAFLGGYPIGLWEKFEPIIDYHRLNQVGERGMWLEHFDDFAYSLMEVRDADRVNYAQRYQRFNPRHV